VIRYRLISLVLAIVVSTLFMLLLQAAPDDVNADKKNTDEKDTLPKINPSSDTSDRDKIIEAIEEGDDYLVLDKNTKLYFYHVKFKSADILAKYLQLIGPQPRKVFAYGNYIATLPTISFKTAKANQPADTLIIEDSPEKIEEIKKTLQLLDVPKTQVLVESRIVEINHSDEFHFGFDFDFDQSKISKALFYAFDLNYSPDSFISSVPTSSPFQGMSINFESIGFSLKDFGISELSLRLLSLTGNAEIITSPRLLIEEGEKGQIYSGESFYVSTVEETSGVVNIRYISKQIGIKMDIFPLIIGDNYVKLRLVPNISDIIGYTTSSGSTGSVPILSTRKTDTLTTVESGKTLILGRLIINESAIVTRGIPVISDIPLIGELFKSHDNSKSNSEIMFIITPTIFDVTKDDFPVK